MANLKPDSSLPDPASMALFGFGKDSKVGGGSLDLVLAYLEDAQRVRSPFYAEDNRKLEVSCQIQSLDEGAGTFTLQASGPFSSSKGAKVDLLLYHEGLRIGGTSRLVEQRGMTLVLELPPTLQIQERRKQPRGRINPKEAATVTALTSLFEGIGITGSLENISELGCRVRVDKAMNVKDEKRMPLGRALVPVGHQFMLIKLNKVPRCPAVMELTGKVAYSDDSSGLCLGLTFERTDQAGSIKNLVSSRVGSQASTLPPKSRRRPQEAPVREEAPERPSRPVEAPAGALEKSNEPREPAAPAAIQSPVAGTPPAVQAASAAPPVRNSAVLRLRKKGRGLTLLARGGRGDLLRAHLCEEGYGRVLVAQDWTEAIQYLHEGGEHLLLVDLDAPLDETLLMISKLRDSEMELPPVIVAADEVSPALVIAALRQGVSQLLVRPYTPDESFSALIEKQIGLVE